MYPSRKKLYKLQIYLNFVNVLSTSFLTIIDSLGGLDLKEDFSGKHEKQSTIAI